MSLSKRAREQLQRRLRQGLRRVAAELTADAKRRASRHVFTGALRQAITYADGPGHSVLWGIALGQAPHGRYLELGFRPHWVPARYIGRWMQRVGVGVSREAGGRRYKTIRAVALGLYVGGPGSTLEYGGAGARGRLFAGRGKLIEQTWPTAGGHSPYLPDGAVGYPVLRPTVAKASKQRLMAAFKRGWERA